MTGHALAVLGFRMTLQALAGADPSGSEAAVRKLLGVQHDQRVQEVGMALMGADAAATDGEAGAWSSAFLFNRCLTIAGGTSDVQRNVIAERLLGLPRDPEPGTEHPRPQLTRVSAERLASPTWANASCDTTTCRSATRRRAIDHELTRTDLVMYAGASGDFNPMHHDEVAAQAAGLPSVFGHGMFSAGLLATAITNYVGIGNLASYQCASRSRRGPARCSARASP